MGLGTILIIILILLLIGALPNWGYSRGFGYGPSGILGVVLVVIGVAAQTFTTSVNGAVQLGTEPSMRGRVLALLLAIALGGTPLGAPLAGWVADRWCEILPMALEAKVRLMAFSGPLERLDVVDAFMNSGSPAH